jgi:hypothetical protein
VTIGGVSFWGSPYTPEFLNGAFMYPRDPAVTKYWDQIPLGLDVLITHGPLLGILDQVVPGGDHLGCEELMRAVEEKRIAPGKRANCRGHIDPGPSHHFEGLDNGTANVG